MRIHVYSDRIDCYIDVKEPKELEDWDKDPKKALEKYTHDYLEMLGKNLWFNLCKFKIEEKTFNG